MREDPEKDHEVDNALGDFGANLLVSTQRSALELMDRGTQYLLQQLTGGAGGIKRMFNQEAPVPSRPVQKILLLMMCATRAILFFCPMSMILCSM